MSEFLMPSLGADMEAGTLVEQLVEAGSPVARGDIIAAVETQKGVIEIEVFEDGVLDGWLASIGDKVPVGTPLALIRSAGTPDTPDIPEPEAPRPTPSETPQPTDPEPEPVQPEDLPPSDPAPTGPVPEMPPGPEVEIPPPETRLRVTPAARRLAAQKGIDLTTLAPEKGKVISRTTVQSATGQPPEKSKDIRSAIAAAMSRSKREIPHYYLSHTVDMMAVDTFVAKVNADRAPDARLLPTALYALAIARALKTFPEFNGHFADGTFLASTAVHLGIATHLRSGGLVAPALFDVEASDPDRVMQELRDLVTRVRAGRYRARELSSGTITMTSLGDRGVDVLYGVIYPPQVAIVGIGKPRLLPWVEKGKITARKIANITLAADHRVSDGHRGALFLRKIDDYLQTPEKL